MDSSFDLSKIISAVSENPELIAGFKSLFSSSVFKSDSKEDEREKTEEPIEEAKNVFKENTENMEKESVAVAKMSESAVRKKRRKELLCALKPYVCNERSKAIDTMLSLTDVLDILKEG